MAEPILDASRVVSGIGQGVPAGMPRHVGVVRKSEARSGADALDEGLTASGVKGPPRSVAKTKA
jgi:hypothetical protein